MESGLVAVGGSEIYYESHGSGPAVLFLHAGVADSRMWRDQLHIHGARCVVFDQRGYGKTAWVPGTYADWKDSIAVLDTLGIEEAVVVGCSLGGSIAFHLALAAPSRVRGLVVVGAAASGWEPDGGWADDPLEKEAAEAARSGDVDRVVDVDTRMWLAGYGRGLEEVDPGLIDLFRDMDRGPAASEPERNDHVERFGPFVDRLPEIAAPALVMVGQYDHPDLLTSARFLADRLTGDDPVVIPDAAHLPSLEQPERFNQELSAFLDSLPD